MNPHDHDLDLIMALAEGRLDAAAAKAARRQIDGCEECTRDLQLQEAALAAFAAMPAARLTDIEAARLKRDVDTALGHERTVVAPAVRRQPRFNWVPLASVAAVLLALVLVAPSLQLLGGSSDDAGDVVAFDAAEDATTSTAAAEAPESAALQVQESDRASDGAITEDLDDAGGGDDAADEAAPTTVAAAPAEGYDVRLVTLLDELAAELDPDGTAGDARQTAALFGVTPVRVDEIERCLEEGQMVFDEETRDSFALGGLEQEVPPLWITAHLVGDELRLVGHDAGTCEVLAVSSPPGG